MTKKIALFFCAALLLSTACGRPENEKQAKFQRQANIEKYVRKAREINRLGKERAKPLKIDELVNAALLTNQTQEPDGAFFTRLFAQNRLALTEAARREYGQTSALSLSDMFERYRTQAQAAAQEASSAVSLAENLRSIRQKQNEEWGLFISEQENKKRIFPSQALLDGALRDMQVSGGEFLDRISFYYGQETSDLCRPVLKTALQDYAYAMAGSPDEPALDAALQQAAARASAQIKQITSDSGDPLGTTSEEHISSLRAAMIARHHELEGRIEKLYGKDAVLQARGVFNELMEQAGKTLRQDARLSQKKRTLERLNERYRADLLALQKRWNDDLEKEASLPPAGLISSR